MFSNAPSNAPSNARQPFQAMHATQRNATNATQSTLPDRNLAFLTVRVGLWITRISATKAVA